MPKGFQTPDTLVILAVMAILAMLASYIIPAGYFTPGEEGVQSETFQYLASEDGSPEHLSVSLFVAEADMGERLIKRFPSDAVSDTGLSNILFEGLVSGSKYGAAIGVIAFILIIGGAFGIIQATGAIEQGIHKTIELVKDRSFWAIPILFTLFSLGGAIFGMGVESIAFAVILVPAFLAMGFDRITAVMTTYVATQIGFATSWMNPFSVAIAQGIAEVPVLSGSGFRLIMWATFTTLGIAFTLHHALRIRKQPSLSPTYQADEAHRLDTNNKASSQTDFRKGHLAVLIAFLMGIIWVTWGVVQHQYFIPEIATQFLITGLVCGLLGMLFRLPGMNLNAMAAAFQEGAKTMLPAVLIVALAKGLVIILGGSDPHSPSILNTLLYHFSQILGGVPGFLAVWSMYLFQAIFNFFVTSGSGQAALTMPVMAPLADLLGVSRQMAVLAFQLGDGLTNLIVPTSAALMGTLAVAKIDWLVWVRYQIRFQLVLILLATLFLLIAHSIGFQ